MQEIPMDVAGFIRRFRDLPVGEFLEANPHPFLIGVLDGLAAHELGYDTIDPKSRPPADPAAPVPGAVPRSRRQVYPVLARPQTPFSHMVSVGRASNNDIVLAYEGVSKLHAVFTRTGEGDWHVSDSDSQAGTVLDGERLPPGEKRPISDGATVAFGPASLTFVTANSLHGMLAELARQTDS